MSELHKLNKYLDKCKETHNNKYTYNISAVSVLKNIRNTVLDITCPLHGEFKQSLSAHLVGKGCKLCAAARVSASRSASRMSIDKFLDMAHAVHGDTYEYDDTIDYTNHKIGITCPIHGKFYQSIHNHLNGCGCLRCNRGKTNREELQAAFISKSKNIHNNKYTYSNVIYTTAKDKVTIVCPVHGEFQQTPDAHLAGKGCIYCAASDYAYTDLPTMLYYIKIKYEDIIAYKIGITSKTVEDRFCASELSRITILKTWMFETGKTAYDEEQKVLSTYKDSKYTGVNLLMSGNTELFNSDILGLDNE